MGRDREHQPYSQGQSAEDIIGNTHLLVNYERTSLKMRLWRRGRGFYFKNKPTFTHTLVHTYSQPDKKVPVHHPGIKTWVSRICSGSLTVTRVQGTQLCRPHPGSFHGW